MTTVLHSHSHSNNATCNSASCNSPSRLWRSIQTMIHADDRAGFSRLCQDTDRAPLVARVLTTQRLANDASLYPASHKHRIVQFDSLVRGEALQMFGKGATDLNALQLALLLNHEAMATMMLTFVELHASSPECQMFVNHVWGQRNTSLHLACFWGMSRLVRRLLDLGADVSVRNGRKLGPVDCCTNAECLAMLKKLDHRSKRPPVSIAKPTRRSTPAMPLTRNSADNAEPVPVGQRTTDARTGLQRPSMLLKKAMKNAAELPLPVSPPTDMASDYFAAKTQPMMPMLFDQDPLFSSTPDLAPHHPRDVKMIRANSSLSSISFSSSSSSSSFSSLSSLEESLSGKSTDRDLLWSPPSSPPAVPSLIHDHGHDHGHDDDDEDDDDDTAWKRVPRSLSPLLSQSPALPSVAMPDMERDLDETTLPLRPTCYPTMRQRPIIATRATTDACTMKQPSPKEPTPRQVRFDARIVLLDACMNGELAEVANILGQEIEMGTNKLCSYVDSLHNRSLLHIALLRGQEKVARYLVSVGRVNVNHTDNDGWTALHYTAALGLWKSIEYLASLPETQLNARTRNGWTIYDCVKTEVDRKRCRVLIERAMKRRASSEMRNDLTKAN